MASEQNGVLRELMRRVAGGEGPIPPDDEGAKKQWPILWQLMTDRTGDGEHILTPAKLSVQAGVGLWVVSVSHPDLQTSLDATCACLLDVFDAWEKEAKNPSARWRTWAKGEIKLRKREKGKTGLTV
jgi:hypothetical protein